VANTKCFIKRRSERHIQEQVSNSSMLRKKIYGISAFIEFGKDRVRIAASPFPPRNREMREENDDV